MTQSVEHWLENARNAVTNNQFGQPNLDELETLLKNSAQRQKLLYLHASSPNIQSKVIAYAMHDFADDGFPGAIDPMAPKSPYASVYEAIVDGWRVIHFPLQMAHFEDREIDILGYEFILEKMELSHD
jgi:hypothetical protein